MCVCVCVREREGIMNIANAAVHCSSKYYSLASVLASRAWKEAIEVALSMGLM